MTTAQTAPVKLAPIAARLMAALQYPGMRIMTTLDHLNGRLVAMFPDTCTRCYGSGSFGPQCVKGGVCFKCNGKRTQAPKINKALESRIMEAIAAGGAASLRRTHDRSWSGAQGRCRPV
jgi:DnaJ-class molecular chaperone